MSSCEASFSAVQARITAAAALHQPTSVRLLAVSKTQPGSAVRACAAQGQRAFGENYVQEALSKQRELIDLGLEWHLIGPLQSNKCREVAEHFDWIQSLDRAKLIELLARFRPAELAPLNVLIQVNIDDEAGKSGCAPEQVDALVTGIAGQPRLRLRGLMAIPAPATDPAVRSLAFRQMRSLYDTLKASYAQVDTLSMGMSEDLELAIAEGSTMVRVGSALFGQRSAR